MPIYEYICTACNERFSLLRNVTSNEDDLRCPSCSGRKVKKVMSSFCCSTGAASSGVSSGPSRGFGGGG
jgi:putative FmdB family regulatory protein